MTTQQELADQIEQSCHVTIEHGLVGGTILTKDKLDTIVTALRAHDDMLDALRAANDLYLMAPPNAFANGVTDNTNMIDEGEVFAAGVADQIRAAITKATGQS